MKRQIMLDNGSVLELVDSTDKLGIRHVTATAGDDSVDITEAAVALEALGLYRLVVGHAPTHAIKAHVKRFGHALKMEGYRQAYDDPRDGVLAAKLNEVLA